jgi:acylphosphatase
VHGRVQGVFFRDSTRKVALSLAIDGHAINLPDGTVEVLACGEEYALGSLEEWLHHGPPRAAVSKLVKCDVDRADCAPGGRFRCG